MVPQGETMLQLEATDTNCRESATPFQTRRASRALGLEVIGLDLSRPLDDETIAALRRALADHGVLLFRNQKITPQQHVDFSRRFGELEHHVLKDYLMAGHPELYVISNVKKDGKAVGRAGAGQYWHSDLSYVEKPALGSIMYAIEIPETGGDTLFANMFAAYESLSAPIQQLLSGLKAVHDFAYTQATQIAGKGRTRPASAEELAKVPPVEHPVIRAHPENGRKALYANQGMTTHISGLQPMESSAILQMLFAHSTRPEFVYRHSWRVGDVVFWDNRSTMHCAVDDYSDDERRLMVRTTIKGDRPC
jgi:taurine dioxygenase